VLLELLASQRSLAGIANANRVEESKQLGELRVAASGTTGCSGSNAMPRTSPFG
jgi:hypothetical protein